jgi:hypothetical protein
MAKDSARVMGTEMGTGSAKGSDLDWATEMDSAKD